MFSIRRATLDDVETIAAHRRSMFFEMGHRDAAALDAMVEAFLPWVRRKMAEEEYLAWLAIAADGSVAAGAGLWIMDWPPHMVGPGSPRGNILSVYTRPDCRRQGLARKLTETAIEWCRTHSISAIVLHGSEDGRALYKALGFKPTNEMRLLLPPPL
jgi:GNAT superfamily N-acetyltransferase